MLCLCFGGNNAHFWSCGTAGLEGTHVYLVILTNRFPYRTCPFLSTPVVCGRLGSLLSPTLMLLILLISAILIGVGWYLMVLIKAFFKNILCYNKTRLPHTWSSFFY